MQENAAESSEASSRSGAVTERSRDWSAAALAAAGRGLLFLGLSTVCAVIFVFEVRLSLLGTNLADYVARNEVELVWRMRTLQFAGVATALVGGAALFLCVRRGPSVAGSLERWGRIGLPFAPLVALPPLFVRDVWHGNELVFLAVAAIFGLVFEATLRRAYEALGGSIDGLSARVPAKTGLWIARAAVGAAVLYYAVRVSQLTCLNHERLQTATSDLGEFDNLFYNALHGHPFRAPGIDGDLRNWGALKVHAEFVLYLLLPFYALHPGPQALLVIQSTVVALTAIPLYLFAARRAGQTSGVVVAVAYLLLPFVERPNFYDFHFVPVGMFFAACTLCLVERWSAEDAPTKRQRVLFWATFALALLSREDIAAGMIIVGVFVALTGHHPRLGYVMAVIAASYFAVMKFAIMPRFGVMWFDAIYQDLKVPGQRGFPAVINTLVSNPVFAVKKLLIEPKFLYALHLTVPLLFLWVRSWPLFAAALPGFLFTLAVTNRPPMSESSFQYAYLWAPYVVAASAIALGQMAEKGIAGVAARRAATTALLAVALVVSMHQGALLGAESIHGGFTEKRLSITPEEKARAAQLESLVAMIPRDASVVATEMIGAHVSTRLVFYSLKYTFGKDTDYFLVGLVGIPEERVRIREALAGDYGVVARAGPFYLGKRGAPKAQNGTLELEMR